MTEFSVEAEVSVGLLYPDGSSPQIRYAKEATKRSGTAIAIQNRSGIILAVERILESVLEDPNGLHDSSFKVVDRNIAIVGTGHSPDISRALFYARGQARNYVERYQKDIEVDDLVRRIGDYFQTYTQQGKSRVFGCDLIVAAWDIENGPTICKVDSRGKITKWYSCAIGKGASLALSEIQKYNFNEMSIADLAETSGKIIYKAHQSNRFKNFRFRIGVISTDTGGIWKIDPPDLCSLGMTAGVAIENQEYADLERQEREICKSMETDPSSPIPIMNFGD